MQIVSINGQQVHNPFCALNLPGDAVHKIATDFKNTTTYQITEYLDKYTLKPALTLLPNNKILSHSATPATAISRLNHATRRDLLRRLKTK